MKHRTVVFGALGALAVTLPGSELVTASATGTIDATEWNRPFDTMAFGLHEVAEYYYYPGWHEPSSVLECLVSVAAYRTLSSHLQNVVMQAGMAESEFVVMEFAARNRQALITLIEEHGTQLQRFQDDVLEYLRGHADNVMTQLAAADPALGRVYSAYRRFAESIRGGHQISEDYIGRSDTA